MNLPLEFINSIKNITAESDLFFRALDQAYHKGVRINSLKIAKDYLINIMGNNYENVKWQPEGFYYENSDITKSPLYAAGLYYIQEPSAMLPATVLPVNENDFVLDLCAAPGGKTTLLGEKLKGTGILVANDISFSRCSALLKNIERHGIKNYTILNENSNKLANVFVSFFDKILIDAPCSGEGMFRKDPKAMKSWIERGPFYYRDIQRKLLKDGAKMLKSGGVLAYSTCTFNTIENEDIIEDFLSNHEDFEPLFIDHATLGISEGLNGLSFCGRIWPHMQKGEGHFVALLRKKGESSPNYYYDSNASLKNVRSLSEFIEENLKFFPERNIVSFGDTLMLNPIPNLTGIRIFRSGMSIGNFKRGRFEPSQALAMSLTPEEVKNFIGFDRNDVSVKKFLKGESLDFDGPSGWFLVCIDKYPLGWAKSSGGRLKNKIPIGWI